MGFIHHHSGEDSPWGGRAQAGGWSGCDDALAADGGVGLYEVL